MFGIAESTATRKATEAFRPKGRSRGQDNTVWTEKQYQALSKSWAKSEHDFDPTYLLLVGGVSPIDFRLRFAQSRLRHDFTPSHWSHVALVRGPFAGPATELIEVSLEPAAGFQTPPATNGLQSSYLNRYSDPEANPNIALVEIPVDGATWTAKTTRTERALLEQFAKQRSLLDVPNLIVTWLSYVWGVGNGANPLEAGQGIPSAAAVETILSATGYELSPGLDNGSSTPEAIWQTANWWHPYYESVGIPPLRGAFNVAHRINVGEPRRANSDQAPEDSFV